MFLFGQDVDVSSETNNVKIIVKIGIGPLKLLIIRVRLILFGLLTNEKDEHNVAHQNDHGVNFDERYEPEVIPYGFN